MSALPRLSTPGPTPPPRPQRPRFVVPSPWVASKRYSDKARPRARDGLPGRPVVAPFDLSCFGRSVVGVNGRTPFVHEWSSDNSQHHTHSHRHSNTNNPSGNGSGSRDYGGLSFVQTLRAPSATPLQRVCQSARAIFCGGRDGSVYIRGKSSRMWSHLLAHRRPITALSALATAIQNPTEDADVLLTGSEDGECAVYDVHTRLEVSRCAAHEAPVSWVSTLPGTSKCFLSASRDGDAALWDARLPPATRVVRKYQSGEHPICGARVVGHDALCTMSLTPPSGGVDGGASACGAVTLTYFNLGTQGDLQGAMTDQATFDWKGVNIHLALLLRPSLAQYRGTGATGGRHPVRLLTVGQRKGETAVQCCEERGERVLSVETLQRKVSGLAVSVDETLLFLASPGPSLCMVPLMSQKSIANAIGARRAGGQGRFDTTPGSDGGHTAMAKLRLFNGRLARLGAEGRASEMLELLMSMERVHRVPPTDLSFELVLRGLLKHGDFIMIQRCLVGMREARMRPTEKTAIKLLRFAATYRGGVDKVVLLAATRMTLDQLGSLRAQSVREEFISLLSTAPTAESLQLAYESLRDAVLKRRRVSRHLLKTFLDAASSRRATGLAYDIFQLMRTHVATGHAESCLQIEEYESVAVMLALARDLVKPIQLLSNAIATFGLRAVFAFGCKLVESYGRAGVLPQAQEVANLLLRNREGHRWGWTQSALLDAALVAAALSCAQVSTAMQALMHVPKRPRQSMSTNTDATDALAEAGASLVLVLEADGRRTDDAIRVIERMQELGLSVPHSCLVSLLSCLALDRRISEAMYLFNTLRHFKNADSGTAGADGAGDADGADEVAAREQADMKMRALAVLISAVGRAGLPLVLDKLLLEVKQDTVLQRDNRIIESSLEALRCTAQPRRALFLLADLEATGKRLPTSRLAYNNVILCHGMTCNTELCEDVVQEMRRARFPPDTDTFAACISATLSAGKPGRAAAWYLRFCRWQRKRFDKSSSKIATWYRSISSQAEASLSTTTSSTFSPSPPVADTPAAPPSAETIVFKEVRRLVAEQHRLRRSSRSHPNIHEAFMSMCESLISNGRLLHIVWRCLVGYYQLVGDVGHESCTAFLRACLAKPAGLPVATVDSYVDWSLLAASPRVIARIPPHVVGRAVERVCRSETCRRTLDFAVRKVREYAAAGGRSSSSILEALLYSVARTNADTKAVDGAAVEPHTRGSGHTPMQTPMQMYQSALSSGVVVSDRARLLLIRALAAGRDLAGAIALLRSFTAKGHRVQPLGWLAKAAAAAGRVEDAVWIGKCAFRANTRVPVDELRQAARASANLGAEAREKLLHDIRKISTSTQRQKGRQRGPSPC